MILTGVDTETHLIAPARQAPRLVCVSYDSTQNERGVDCAPEGLRRFAQWLIEPERLIVGHNFAYDGVVFVEAAHEYFGTQYGVHFAALLFDAYSRNRIVCTMLREKLADLAQGRLQPTNAKADLPSEAHLPHDKKSGYYSLAGCLWRHFRIDVGADKAEGAFRTRYHEVDGLPVHLWPDGFERYAVEDAVHAKQLFCSQEQKWAHLGCFDVQGDRSRAALTLRFAEVRGVRTSESEVERLENYCTETTHALEKKLVQAGLMREEWRKDQYAFVENQAVIRQWIEAAYTQAGKDPPRTAKSKTHPDGQISMNGEALKPLESMYPADSPFQLLVEMSKTSIAYDILSKYAPALRKGCRVPLHPRYNAMLETGRTSCSDQIQTPPRDNMPCFGCGLEPRKVPAGATKCPRCGGFIGDVRRCYVARPGFVYGFVDYDQLEMCTLAQCMYDMFGSSTIGDAIAQNKDLHCMLGADIEQTDYESFAHRAKVLKQPEAKHTRQTSKGGNFGFPGAMKEQGFIDYVKNYGVTDMTMQRATIVRQAWLRRWHDMPRYFSTIKGMGFAQFGATATIRHPRTGLIAGDRYYTAACNFFFQSLAATGALDAGFFLCREAYADPYSPLYGSRPVFFLHDEWGLEHPETRAPEAAVRQGDVMRAVMQQWCPNVPIRGADPVLTSAWYKAAEPVYDINGRLTPWFPAQ